MVEEANGEAHIPAQQSAPGQATRLSPSHADPRGPGHIEDSAAEGSGPPLGLIWRVRDRATFEALRREGRRTRRGSLTVTYVPADDTPPRVAYGIGRKVGPAVVRNRVRRRLRAAARALAATPGLASGAYLVTVGPGAADASAAELHRLLGEACAAVTARRQPSRPTAPPQVPA